jgi:AraC-like DNA-binding protein
MSDSADHSVDQLPLDTTAAGTSSTVTGVGIGVEPARADDEGDHTLLPCGAYRLDRGVVHPFLRGLPDVLHLPARLGRHASLRSTIDLIATDLTEGRPGADVALPALLDLLLVYALRAWPEDQCPQEAGGWCAALKDPAVAAALDRMHRDSAHPWTVRELADAVGLSRTTFAARFTAYVGRPPMAYLTWWRLSTVARMLRDSSAPLAGVARRVAYGSEFALAHAFKREFGTAPGGFRRSRTAPDGTARSGGEQGLTPATRQEPAPVACPDAVTSARTPWPGMSGPSRAIGRPARQHQRVTAVTGQRDSWPVTGSLWALGLINGAAPGGRVVAVTSRHC